MIPILALVLAQALSPGSSTGLNLNTQAIEGRQNGVKLKNTRQWVIDCRTNMTCAADGGTLYLSSSGGAGGGVSSADGGTAAPLGAPFVTWQTDGTLTSSRKLAAGNYTALDVATPGEAQIDWSHGLTCSAGQAMTSSGSSALVCTSTITASDVQCAGTCVADAEIVGVAGGKVSGAVATATALAADPADCSAGQYATTISASGDLTCAQVATSQLSGTITNAQLASSYSGIGTCGANTWASTLSANAAPTCTQPAFSNLSGSVTIPQGGTGIASRVDDDLVVGTGANTTATKVLPSCSNATTSKLLYDSTANTFSCGTDQASAGGGGNFVEAEVDFGAAGDTIATVVVTGQAWVSATSKILCDVAMVATADRAEGAEDAILEGIEASFHSRSAGVGFTIVAAPVNGVAIGKYKVHCSGG